MRLLVHRLAFKTNPLYYLLNLSYIPSSSLVIWRNFFKEAFLIDFLYKITFLHYSLNLFLLGSFFFNFNFINVLQVKSFYKNITLLYNSLVSLELSIQGVVYNVFKLILFSLILLLL